jgi:hypothetical protein
MLGRSGLEFAASWTSEGMSMRKTWIGLAVTAAALLAGSFVSANAASLPAPATLCALLAGDANGGFTNTKWRKTDAGGYWCDSAGHMFPGAAGVVYMVDFQAGGPARARAAWFYFHIKMYDSMRRADQIAAPILSRLSAIFAAANAGPVPDDLVQAVNQVATTSLSTPLGAARTRFTPGSRADSPYNGALFEVQLAAPPP